LLGGTDGGVRPYTSGLCPLILDEGRDVLLGDATTESGAGNLGEIYTVLAGDLAN
jgi:hypothetical protein